MSIKKATLFLWAFALHRNKVAFSQGSHV